MSNILSISDEWLERLEKLHNKGYNSMTYEVTTPNLEQQSIMRSVMSTIIAMIEIERDKGKSVKDILYTIEGNLRYQIRGRENLIPIAKEKLVANSIVEVIKVTLDEFGDITSMEGNNI